ncbi:MAG: acyl-[acyl-carrier-protein]--UDP-N-acetylglucosamine O-acyltransferase [Cenarchaeum sp. SB0665_bin_23]|nr:acyl-[acyl-carrier-protein]--UDP-N-acetylglucosamine O-acyltransferase [Cenarchaeum sp. SB0664_bin_35]MXY60924.1 acyl-[acyl-carrier-protein]--UDP-N-acetylglucosamine O-acyltransferase [Cenarchaeum sp. SB0665_bin_23]MXZ94048.1 acyl-[acyl-carrier-protein]--UDP-N-acetylglucosamine O-acyltransferase [Cenarchaeum sp. SB0666_bin_15]MYB46897.1 acyl-[acyl-carrier-protein]--UDP-N-acetylglucosamine O-acyltransferase [Cenarchaeum sp. SB0662_bin_33]MYD59088.1 acyl-[acyl-carrier-protein]--UDP-N-acetylglu
MGVQIGRGTDIHDTAVIQGDTIIGSNNHIFPYVIIGTGPQHIIHSTSKGRIVIHNNNTIREFTTIHEPTTELTSIGSDCYIMSYCHIAHDSILHDGIIMSTRVTLGGHVQIHDYANIGQGAEIHQYRRVGSYAMIGMGCPIVKDVPPFALINRGRFTRINRGGLERAGIPAREIDAIHDAYSGGFESGGETWYERKIESFLSGSETVYTPDF